MNINRISLLLVLSISLFLSTVLPIFALSISPSTFVIDPVIPGQKRIVTISIGRMNAGESIRLESKITGAIANHISIVNPELLTMDAGTSGITIPLEIDVTGEKNGTELTGRIEFSEKDLVAKNGVPANYSNAASTVIIRVGDSDASLLTVSNFMTSWNPVTDSIDMSFTETNNRNFPAHISKVVYTFTAVDNSREPEVREITFDDSDLLPGESRERTTSLAIDSEHVGSYTYVLDFIDEKGRVALSKQTNGMTFHYDVVRRRAITKYLMYLIGAAALVAGLFVADYLYLKKKYRKQ